MTQHPPNPAYKPETIHARLGSAFYDLVEAARFPDLVLRFRNGRAEKRVGLAALTEADWVRHFGRFEPLPGSFPQPLALRYHGHQFRHYNPDLGDGRGFLFAQLRDLEDGRLLDLGTKGSGRTPWSRTADGRLTLKGGVREVLASEMLGAMGVETSESLSLIETGEELDRHDEPSPTRAAVLVRLSHSHIRIGTFQRLLALGLHEEIGLLLDHVAAHYMAQTRADTTADMAVNVLQHVVANVARVGAQWIASGFVHGVLNTDNINVTGESFDYGPWRFLPRYDPTFTAAYFDQTGLYAFGRQADALAWNLTRFAETLVPVSSVEALEPALNLFWSRFQSELGLAICRRLGLAPQDDAANAQLALALFAFLGAAETGFEQFFFDWRGGREGADRAAKSPAASAYGAAAFADLQKQFEAYTPVPGALAHPYFNRTTPRTMLIEEMEAIWAPIAQDDDWSAFNAALDEIAVMRQAYRTPL